MYMLRDVRLVWEVYATDSCALLINYSFFFLLINDHIAQIVKGDYAIRA